MIIASFLGGNRSLRSPLLLYNIINMQLTARRTSAKRQNMRDQRTQKNTHGKNQHRGRQTYTYAGTNTHTHTHLSDYCLNIHRNTSGKLVFIPSLCRWLMCECVWARLFLEHSKHSAVTSGAPHSRKHSLRFYYETPSAAPAPCIRLLFEVKSKKLEMKWIESRKKRLTSLMQARIFGSFDECCHFHGIFCQH